MMTVFLIAKYSTYAENLKNVGMARVSQKKPDQSKNKDFRTTIRKRTLSEFLEDICE